MPVIPVDICVSDDIYLKILDGSLELFGMVKDNGHKVRKHLPVVSHAAKTGVEKAVAVMKNHKGASLIAGGALAIGTGVAVAVACVINNKKKKEVEHFCKCLDTYCNSIKTGILTEDIIDDLINSLNDLNEKNISVKMSANEFIEVVFAIFDYTDRLAKANGVNIKLKKPNKKSSSAMIINLQDYLCIQKQIISDAG